MKDWDAQLITGGSSSLKSVAPLVGPRWGVDDADGRESMIEHDLAADDDDAARDWLSAYNRGDVEATLAVREWMDSILLQGIDEGHDHAAGRSHR